MRFARPASEHARGGRIAAAVSTGAAARGLSSLLTLVSLPLAVRYLGAERFGVWAAITSTVVLLNLLDLGVASTLTNHIAKSYAVGDRHYAARYAGNALALTMWIAGLAGVALAVVWPRIDWMLLFNVASHVPCSEINRTAGVAAALVLIGLPASLASRIFAGYQEVHLSNLVAAVSSVANVAGLSLGIELRGHYASPACDVCGIHPDLQLRSSGHHSFSSQTVATATTGVVGMEHRPRTARLGLRVFSHSDCRCRGLQFRQSGVSHYLGAAQVTPYNVTWRLVTLTAVLPSLVFPALWPAYAEAYALQDYAWMRRTFRIVMRATLALNLACGAVFITFGKTLIRLWAGPAAVPPTALLAAMALWAVISGFMTLESCLLAAVNRTRVQGVLSIVAAALNLGVSIVLVEHIGAVGVIAGTILSYLVVLVVPQSLIVRDILNGLPDQSLRQCQQSPVASCQ